jgi:DNA-binding transcriptional ArsR family regulator
MHAMNKKSVRAMRLDAGLLEAMADALRVLGHRHRLRIIESLDLEGEAPVGALVDALGLPQATVSHHLGIMKRVGLIAGERRGKEVWYRIANPNAVTILDCIRRKAGAK